MDYYPYGEPFQEWNWDLAEREKGMSSNRYLYSGNERETGLGVNQYDFQARTYVASFPRLTSPDPLASKNPGISVYSYFFGDPINLTDPAGDIPTPYESALMCGAVYHVTDKDDPINYEYCLKELAKRGWTLSSFRTNLNTVHTLDDKSGLQAALFERTIDGKTEYAYAFAGTDSFDDAWQDFSQLFGLSSQYEEAVKQAQVADGIVGQNELTFVGHSLGGGEAAAASMATGRNAITFNPAALSSFTKARLGLKEHSKITNYRAIAPGEGNKRIGGDFVNNAQDKVGMRAPGETIPIIIPTRNSFEAHRIKHMINALKPLTK